MNKKISNLLKAATLTSSFALLINADSCSSTTTPAATTVDVVSTLTAAGFDAAVTTTDAASKLMTDYKAGKVAADAVLKNADIKSAGLAVLKDANGKALTALTATDLTEANVAKIVAQLKVASTGLDVAAFLAKIDAVSGEIDAKLLTDDANVKALLTGLNTTLGTKAKLDAFFKSQAGISSLLNPVDPLAALKADPTWYGDLKLAAIGFDVNDAPLTTGKAHNVAALVADPVILGGKVGAALTADDIINATTFVLDSTKAVTTGTYGVTAKDLVTVTTGNLTLTTVKTVADLEVYADTTDKTKGYKAATTLNVTGLDGRWYIEQDINLNLAKLTLAKGNVWTIKAADVALWAKDLVIGAAAASGAKDAAPAYLVVEGKNAAVIGQNVTVDGAFVVNNGVAVFADTALNPFSTEAKGPDFTAKGTINLYQNSVMTLNDGATVKSKYLNADFSTINSHGATIDAISYLGNGAWVEAMNVTTAIKTTTFNQDVQVYYADKGDAVTFCVNVDATANTGAGAGVLYAARKYQSANFLFNGNLTVARPGKDFVFSVKLNDPAFALIVTNADSAAKTGEDSFRGGPVASNTFNADKGTKGTFFKVATLAADKAISYINNGKVESSADATAFGDYLKAHSADLIKFTDDKYNEIVSGKAPHNLKVKGFWDSANRILWAAIVHGADTDNAYAIANLNAMQINLNKDIVSDAANMAFENSQVAEMALALASFEGDKTFVSQLGAMKLVAFNNGGLNLNATEGSKFGAMLTMNNVNVGFNTLVANKGAGFEANSSLKAVNALIGANFGSTFAQFTSMFGAASNVQADSSKFFGFSAKAGYNFDMVAPFAMVETFTQNFDSKTLAGVDFANRSKTFTNALAGFDVKAASAKFDGGSVTTGVTVAGGYFNGNNSASAQLEDGIHSVAQSLNNADAGMAMKASFNTQANFADVMNVKASVSGVAGAVKKVEASVSFGVSF